MENMVGQSKNIQLSSNVQAPPSVMSQATQVSSSTQIPQSVIPQGVAPQVNSGFQNTQMPQNVQVPNYSGVNIQIFNPSVAAPGAVLPASNINANNYASMPSYPSNYYTQNLAQPMIGKAQEPEKKKTEKREIVQLTDDYIKNLETYLDNQDKQVRLMGAKEVLLRFQEDSNRKYDLALNALINKMLKDPYQPIRFIALAALEAGNAKGNNESLELLKGIQLNNTKEHSKMEQEDALKASNILLKASGKTIEKEFEVKNKPEKKSEKE